MFEILFLLQIVTSFGHGISVPSAVFPAPSVGMHLVLMDLFRGRAVERLVMRAGTGSSTGAGEPADLPVGWERLQSRRVVLRNNTGRAF